MLPQNDTNKILEKKIYDEYRGEWLLLIAGAYFQKHELIPLLRNWNNFVATILATDNHPQYYAVNNNFKEKFCNYFNMDTFPLSFKEFYEDFLKTPKFLFDERMHDAFRVCRNEEFDREFELSKRKNKDQQKALIRQNFLREFNATKNNLMAKLVELNKDAICLQDAKWLSLFSEQDITQSDVLQMLDNWNEFTNLLQRLESSEQELVYKFKNYVCDYLSIIQDCFPENTRILKYYLAETPIDRKNINIVRALLFEEVHNQILENAINEAVEHLKTDEFFIKLNSHVLDQIRFEIERIDGKYKSNDARIQILKNVDTELNNKILSIMKDEFRKHYPDHYNQSKRENIETDIKHKCKHETLKIIKESLIDNKDLGEHRVWGTRFGRVLLSAVMLITVVPSVIKTFFHKSHSPVLSLKNKSQKKFDEIYCSACKL